MVLAVVMYGCESWTVKKAEHQRIDAFELWCWRRLLRVPWTARRSIQPSHPLLSPSPLAFYPSQYQGLFKWISSSHQVAKAWSFSFSTNPFNEYSGLISFRIDWLDLLVVQGTLKSLLQHHSSKASFVQCSAFFYGPTLIFLHDYWKTHSFDDMDRCCQNNDPAV